MTKISRVGVVCYGNIARSQVLSVYVEKFLKESRKKGAEIYSAGTALREAFPNEKILIKEVEEKLANREIKTKIKRNPWTKKVQNKLQTADLILVADSKIKKDLQAKLNGFNPKYGLHTFYGFIGEGEKDYEDTYDFKKKKQDPEKFGRLFDELERIAKVMVDKLQKIDL